MSYEKCLETAQKKNLKLCPEGYCTAKEKFEVYPSAYANAYAVQVCKGTKPDYEGNYVNHYTTTKDSNKNISKDRKNVHEDVHKEQGLELWFKEKWVNVCEKDKNGEYFPCGRKKASLESKNYPYCRPLNKLPGTKVKTVDELSTKELENMCKKKRSLKQGMNSKPTRIYLLDHL